MPTPLGKVLIGDGTCVVVRVCVSMCVYGGRGACARALAAYLRVRIHVISSKICLLYNCTLHLTKKCINKRLLLYYRAIRLQLYKEQNRHRSNILT